MEEIVSFKHENLTINGILNPGDAELPAIVMCSAGLKYRTGPHRFYVNFAKSLNKAGYSSLRFDYNGIGESQGSFDSDLIHKLHYDIQHGCMVPVTQSAIRFLKSERHYSDIVLFGLCGGALTALLAAIAEPRITTTLLAGLPTCLRGSPPIENEKKRPSKSIHHRLFNTKDWKKLFSAVREPEVLAKALRRGIKQGVAEPREQQQVSRVPLDANLTYRELLRNAFLKFFKEKPRKMLLSFGEVDYFYKVFEDNWLPWLIENDLERKIDLLRIKDANHTLSWQVAYNEFEQTALDYLRSAK